MEKKIPDVGRLAEPELLPLVSLSDGPKHGYAMQDVGHGTGRPMGAGTLYAALTRLEDQGLIGPAVSGRPAAAIAWPLAGIIRLVRMDRLFQGWLDKEVEKLIEMAARPARVPPS